MKKYKIRRAEAADLNRILEIYEIARAFMVRTGNPTQWRDGYPQPDMLRQDMAGECLYVLENGSGIHGVFFFSVTEDPTYNMIEQGSWRSAEPYGVVHRIASDGSGGILGSCLSFCEEKISHLRIDTHFDNKPMQHLLVKFGFEPRGIIYVGDGTPRIAYDRI